MDNSKNILTATFVKVVDSTAKMTLRTISAMKSMVLRHRYRRKAKEINFFLRVDDPMERFEKYLRQFANGVLTVRYFDDPHCPCEDRKSVWMRSYVGGRKTTIFTERIYDIVIEIEGITGDDAIVLRWNPITSRSECDFGSIDPYTIPKDVSDALSDIIRLTEEV